MSNHDRTTEFLRVPVSDHDRTTEFLNDRNAGIRVERVAPVKFMPLRDGALCPARGTIDSAGYDLHASEDLRIQGRSTGLVRLGFATAMHRSIHGRIESRSGMALKGLVVLTGVIDADYRGEWNVILHNLNRGPYDIAKGDRVAQVVFRPTVPVRFEEVSELSDSARGSGGFGSTGG